jgi:hypothetical protein
MDLGKTRRIYRVEPVRLPAPVEPKREQAPPLRPAVVPAR